MTDPAGRDVAVVRAGLEKAEELAVAMEPLAHPVDGTPLHALPDADLRARVGAYWHPVGTCAMGPADDPRSVVDGQGAVHGVAGLRVADASVLPTVPAANTQLPVLAVAEMLADTLRT
ncbi:GMC oxidoreductase [Streptomyces cinerochromogenes]|uniref:GMC oxidoreductase n=1 Tax=Streptomyces cinerochromogenes TaxID=66422 RepID=A0ABW7BFE6_9ACTN